MKRHKALCQENPIEGSSSVSRGRTPSIESQEFEYTRHGTVNLLFFLMVHSGQMEVAIEASKDAQHSIRELKAFRQPGYRSARVIGSMEGPGRPPVPRGAHVLAVQPHATIGLSRQGLETRRPGCL